MKEKLFKQTQQTYHTWHIHLTALKPGIFVTSFSSMSYYSNVRLISKMNFNSCFFVLKTYFGNEPGLGFNLRMQFNA